MTDIAGAKKPFYNLWMFPYPSAEGLHVGHAFASTISDVYGRYKRHLGYDVFQPIGYDSFGIHSENFALKIGEHPKKFTDRAIGNYARQLQAMGHMYDWTRTVTTSSPDYYKWTQWLFVQMFKNGLAYRAKAPVNFCPKCKTVLSDEQVIDGACERCKAEVIKKEMEQWFFKITAYADRLLENLDNLDWTTKIKLTQKNWIGRKTGALIKFSDIEIFTTRADTIFGATFVVLSPNHPLAGKIKSVINPVNKKKIPVFVDEYVLDTVGTGAIMGVPAHDERDFAFAQKVGLPIVEVIKKPAEADFSVGNVDALVPDPSSNASVAKSIGLVKMDMDPEGVEPSQPNLTGQAPHRRGPISPSVYTDYGILVNSKKYDGLTSGEAVEKIIVDLGEKVAKKTAIYHLRDWLISRQRYWGPPIPMIYCQKCQWQPVQEIDLPVLLPDISDYQPEGNGRGPLANHEEFYKTKCPNCGGGAIRETDVSDTFLDSSWYELRYPSTEQTKAPFDQEVTKRWLPVDMYTGGAEHAVLHLLYFRFVTMVLKDLGFLDFEEPTKSFFAHGMIIKDGAKMSKSRGNVVNPDEYIEKYGADALRLYFMFMGPASDGGDFRDSGMAGMRRWVEKVYQIISTQITNLPTSGKPDVMLQKLLGGMAVKAAKDIEARHYNTTIAKMMEFLNVLQKNKSQMSKPQLESFLIIFSVFAPHLAEQLWEQLNGANTSSVHVAAWPKGQSEIVVENMPLAVMINGKLRGTVMADTQELAEKLARRKISKWLENQTIQKVIYVPGRVINFVIK